MKAYNLERVEKEYEMHQQAWLNQIVQAQEKVGKEYKPLYKSFDEFYDYEERKKEVVKPKPKVDKRYNHLVKVAENIREFKRLRRGG